MKTCPTCHKPIPNDMCSCDYCGYEYPLHETTAQQFMNWLGRPFRAKCPACGSRNTKVVGGEYTRNYTTYGDVWPLVQILFGPRRTQQCQDCGHLWTE